MGCRSRADAVRNSAYFSGVAPICVAKAASLVSEKEADTWASSKRGWEEENELAEIRKRNAEEEDKR